MLLQTDKRLPERVNRFGCFFMSLLERYEIDLRDFTAQEIIQVLEYGESEEAHAYASERFGRDVKVILTEGNTYCYMAAGHTYISEKIKELFESNFILANIGIYRSAELKFWGWPIRQGWNVLADENRYIGEFKTDSGGTHFCSVDFDGQDYEIIYNPDPSITLKNLVSVRIYRKV